MNRNYAEAGALAFVIILSISLFTAAPKQYPSNASYGFALEAEKTIATGGGEPFYQLTRQAFFALGGIGPFDRGILDIVVKYLPVALGVISVTAFYLAIRTRLGPGMGALGAIFLVSSPVFLANSLTGNYSPSIMGIAVFCAALALFLFADVMKNAALGFVLSLAAGWLLGWNTTLGEAGALLAASMVASAVVQFVYYVKEKDYVPYGTRLAALALPVLFFLPSAKLSDLGHFYFGGALRSYAFLAPFACLFVYVAVRDLVRDSKKYELFFLALALGSAGIALLDPLAGAPGMAVGAVFGVAAIRGHLKEKWTSVGFVGFAVAFVVFPFVWGLMPLWSGIALSLLVGGMTVVILLLYEGTEQRAGAAFAGTLLLVGTSLISGVAVAQKGYPTIEPDVGAALNWTKGNLPENAVVGAIGPAGFVEYLSSRKGCCEAEMSRYLLSGGGTEELKGSGAEYIIVDKAYFGDLGGLALVGNVSRINVEVYTFSGYVQDDRLKYYAYMVSKNGDIMKVPVDASANPTREDIAVESVGQVPYGKIRRFEGEDLPILPGSRIALPLYGEKNNLFDIYFETPGGLELVYSVKGGEVRVYKVL